MTCRQLLTHTPDKSTWSVTVCAAERDAYVPSIAELSRYCYSPAHRECPLYCQARAYVKPLGPAEYGRCSFSPLLRVA